jgi:hypothetical protein
MASSDELKALQDEFLDLYSAYMENKDPETKLKLSELVRRIQKIDESFRFNMDHI